MTTTTPHAARRGLPRGIWVLGFVSMASQVAWVRLLIQVTGHTIYTFGLMLGVFIVGLGLGQGRGGSAVGGGTISASPAPHPTCPGVKYPVRDQPLTPAYCLTICMIPCIRV